MLFSADLRWSSQSFSLASWCLKYLFSLLEWHPCQLSWSSLDVVKITFIMWLRKWLHCDWRGACKFIVTFQFALSANKCTLVWLGFRRTGIVVFGILLIGLKESKTLPELIIQFARFPAKISCLAIWRIRVLVMLLIGQKKSEPLLKLTSATKCTEN